MASVNAIAPLTDTYSPSRVIEILSPILTDNRKEKIEAILDNRIGSVQVAFENPFDIHNAFAVMRTCEALGVNDIHIVGKRPTKSKGKSTTSGAYRWIDLHYHQNLEKFLAMRDTGHLLAGAAIDGEYPLAELPVDRPICLIFGNENEGLTTSAITACDRTYKIPMYGMTESLNLSVSAAISLYDILGRKRQQLGKGGDLSSSKRELIKARCYIRSVGFNKAKEILCRFRQ